MSPCNVGRLGPWASHKARLGTNVAEGPDDTGLRTMSAAALQIKPHAQCPLSALSPSAPSTVQIYGQGYAELCSAENNPCCLAMLPCVRSVAPGHRKGHSSPRTEGIVMHRESQRRGSVSVTLVERVEA